MNFSGNQFLFKERVNTFTYTTATQDREAYADVSINGRQYTKFGTLQAVTFVGNLYKVGIPGEGIQQLEPNEEYKVKISNKKHVVKNVLFIGMSKQHPYDTKVNKEIGYEIATENALTDPIMVIEVQGKFNKRRFVDIVEYYLDTIKLEFIKTKAEIIAEGGNLKQCNR